eukprot:CAMPEP_0168789594 /NCGR_PEP_ID=MMETSP0725-20121227/12935_1 /TAXON_ID=265536 /ORGANISM="Amphiprora sp., Strain CCMP467" /LENGTH=250 /DNA_ID=CAMNT_0008839913 /DNA_START=29 /DNA_END=781 /DNA_ORIENTATION=-
MKRCRNILQEQQYNCEVEIDTTAIMMMSKQQQKRRGSSLDDNNSGEHRQQQKMRKRQRRCSNIDLAAQHPNETLCQLYFTSSKQQPKPGTPVTITTPQDEAHRRAHYTLDAVNAVRRGNVSELQNLLVHEGQCFDACNNQGESLLHLACRRGSLETIQFLLEQAGVDVDVVDNMGRSILHDLCWRPRVDLEVLALVLSRVNPRLLMSADVRGHLPFDYSRQRDWREWNTFLTSREAAVLLRRRLQETASN